MKTLRHVTFYFIIFSLFCAITTLSESAPGGFCQVGDVLSSGQSCTDGGTGDDFTVIGGRGQYGFINAATEINLKGNINGKERNFHAKKRADGNWEIESVTGGDTPQTNINEEPPPETPQPPGAGQPVLPPAKVVSIPDANLAAAVRQEIGTSITTNTLLNLTRLYASNSGITDLTGLEHARNLTVLGLYGNTISDISPLSGLTNLAVLDLYENSISDISPLSNLTNLTVLYLFHNSISDISPLSNLANLTDLLLQSNAISDISPLSSLTNLTDLRLSSNAISDISPLAELTQLPSLWISYNSISDISPLSNLTNLTDLRLSSNVISDISPLSNLTNLEELDLDNNKVSDIETLERLMAQGTVVYFRGNPAFETPGPKIEDGWVWLVVPATDEYGGSDAARSGRDFLSEASGGAVTEANVAINGARAGTRVGASVWTTAALTATDSDNLNAIAQDYNLGTDINVPVAYGVVSIHSKTVQKTRMYISGGLVKVWLNGVLIYKNIHDPYRSSVYGTALPVQLNAGDNQLFIAAYRDRGFSSDWWDSSFGFWGASFGFQDGTAYTIGGPPVGSVFDVNGDGIVDGKDIDALITAIVDGITDAKYDVNGDGTVDVNDVVAVNANRDDAAGAGAPARLGNLKLSAGAVNRLQEQIDLLIATGDQSPAAMRTLIYLQQLLVMARPEKTQLLANYPNPFNPETWIPYQLSKSADVTLTIYAVDGHVVRTLALGHQAAGVYQSRSRAAYWDGRNAVGEPVASGLYFYTLTAGDFTATRKMLIRK